MSSFRRLIPAWCSISFRAMIVAGLGAILNMCCASRALAQGAVGGVYIDPAGMLRETSALSQADLSGKLHEAADAPEPSNAASAASPLRKVSLRRLERAVA
ncbi:MAG: hypothetical protein ACM3U2_12615, partial [Deltaproteobacteria bacterium]